MKIIITTVGASLFTNLPEKNVIRKKANGMKNASIEKWEELGGCESDDSDKRIPAIRREYANNFAKHGIDNPTCSAETATLEKIIAEFKQAEDYRVYLLCTATVLSKLAAEMLATFNPLLKGKTFIINEQGNPQQKSEGKAIPSLSITDPKDFKTNGLKNLVSEIRKIWKTQFDGSKNNQVLINASGGYKGVIPFLTILAQLYELPIYYKYQDEDDDKGEKYELIKIDALPFGFDWEMIYEIGPYLNEQWLTQACNYVSGNNNTGDRQKEIYLTILRGLKKQRLIDADDNYKICLATETGIMLQAFFEGAVFSFEDDSDSSNPQGAWRKSIFSRLMEYKFYEWINYNINKNSEDTSCKVYHSTYSFQNHTKTPELDITIESESFGMIGEVKFAKFIHLNFCNTIFPEDKSIKVVEDVFKQIEKRNQLNPDVFRLFTYSSFPFNDEELSLLKEGFQNIRDNMLKNGLDNFKLEGFYVSVGTDLKALLQQSITDFSPQQIYPEPTNLEETPCIK